MERIKIYLKYFKRVSTRNLPWKIASIIAAFFIWFITSNSIDPVRTQIINLPLEFRNESALNNLENEIFLANRASISAQTISVQVRGSQAAINNLNLEAFIDLGTSDIINNLEYTSNISVNVQISGNFGSVDWLATRPQNINISLDTIISREIDIIIGDMPYIPDGFIMGTYSIEPNYLEVRGPSTLINLIENLKLDISNSFVDGHILIERSPYAIDSFGNQIEQNIQIIGEARLLLPVYMRDSVSVLAPIIIGQPMAGFAIYSINLSKDSFEIAGESYAIEDIAPIILDSVSVFGSTSNISIEFDINDYLPMDVFLLDPIERSVIVEIVILPTSTRRISIPIEDVSLIGYNSETMDIISQFIDFDIFGFEHIIQEIQNIPASVSFPNLEIGMHNINVNLLLPSYVNLVGTPPSILIQKFGMDDIDVNYNQNELEYEYNSEISYDNENESEDETIGD